jgi:hypothetical protein
MHSPPWKCGHDWRSHLGLQIPRAAPRPGLWAGRHRGRVDHVIGKTDEAPACEPDRQEIEILIENGKPRMEAIGEVARGASPANSRNHSELFEVGKDATGTGE